ncbi:MAG: hypothetical protein ABIP95_12015 [Pelobium sp.]
MLKSWFKIILVALLIFGGLVLLSLFKDDGNLGFPFWFYKDACEMTMNIETGEMGGITYAVSYLNLFLDILIAFGLAISLVFFLKSRNSKVRRTV